ncbi:hypothetical protein MXB_3615 [Myxobolus squamalis]|nr:hypothetical protein MXB_3615 [Myxobolus squamalis]
MWHLVKKIHISLVTLTVVIISNCSTHWLHVR